MSLSSSRGKLGILLLVAISPVFLLSANRAAQQPKVLAPHKPVPPKIANPRPLQMPSTPQTLVGGFWKTDPNFSSVLYLTNGVKTSSIAVTPILHLSNGLQYTLAPVTLEPSGTAIVSINQALENQGIAGYATLSGYVEVRYDWPWAAICATVRNLDSLHSLVFTYGLQPPPVAAPTQDSANAAQSLQKLEGLWWKQESNVAGFVALSNVTGNPITVNLQVTDAENQTLKNLDLTVTAHGTKTVDLVELLTTASPSGGVLVTHNGPQGGLIVNGGLEDEAVGYSARLPIQVLKQHVIQEGSPTGDAPDIQKASYVELGLMTGAADPMMNFPADTTFAPYAVLRNVSEQPFTVAPTLWWMEGGAAHSAALAPLTVLPHQTQNLNLPTRLAAAGLRNFNGSVNLELDTQGPKEGLVMAGGSVDRKNTYVFEVTPRVILESEAKNIARWSTSNGDDTMVTVWNPADEAQDFKFTLFFSGGHYGYPIHLGPRATQTFNVSEITQSGVPDAEGNIVPAGLHEGSAKLSGAQGENEHILVAMDAGTYNVKKATCNPTCTTCDGPVSWSVNASPVAVPVGSSVQEAFIEVMDTGDQFDASNISTWSSSNASVATVDVDTGLVSGVAAGSFSLAASDSGGETEYFSDCGMDEGEGCPVGTVYPVGIANGTAVWVTLSLRTGISLSPSSNDNKGNNYITDLGSNNLGTFFSSGTSAHLWRTGVEIVGTVSPSNFNGTIILQRQIDYTCTYTGADGSVLDGPCVSDAPDISDTSLLDESPGTSAGQAFDLDAPGLGPSPSAPLGTILRIRTNFHQWATLGDGTTRVSDDFQWYSRISVVNASPGVGLQTDIGGDNIAGVGTTKTSWNLQ